MTSKPQFGWCVEPRAVDQLAQFFATNVTQSYISHSELQFGRAKTPDSWSPNLSEILEAEIFERITAVSLEKRVAAAHVDDELVGIAFVYLNRDVPIPFAIVEDLTIGANQRGHGIGQAFMDWILAEAKSHGMVRAFLESGLDNHKAHHFFERNGFKQVSIVMMAELP